MSLLLHMQVRLTLSRNCARILSRRLPAGADTVSGSPVRRYVKGADLRFQTVSAILSFFLAAMLHPEIQIKAQAELDGVTGLNRLPEFQDKDDLPYISCIVWECFRWNPGPSQP